MITILPNSSRGCTQTTWLESLHSFSFGHFYHPDQMGFGSIRVINEDRISPEGIFGLHHHENMEIISIVLSGTLVHKDNLGNEEHIQAGEIQRMTAGSGIMHSELNPSREEKTHFLQVWILPMNLDLPPSYEKQSLSTQTNELQILGSFNGEKGGVKIHQNVTLYGAHFNGSAQKVINFNTDKNSQYWLHLISGEVLLNDQHHLKAGDGAGITQESTLKILPKHENTQLLLFEMDH